MWRDEASHAPTSSPVKDVVTWRGVLGMGGQAAFNQAVQLAQAIFQVFPLLRPLPVSSAGSKHEGMGEGVTSSPSYRSPSAS